MTIALPAAEDEGPQGFDALIEAFTIFRRYANPHHPTHCDNQTLSVLVDPGAVSAEDAARLGVLGFAAADSGEYFESHRFGAA
jgi:hypothetical protein